MEGEVVLEHDARVFLDVDDVPFPEDRLERDGDRLRVAEEHLVVVLVGGAAREDERPFPAGEEEDQRGAEERAGSLSEQPIVPRPDAGGDSARDPT